MKSYRFSLGNSYPGAVGYVAHVIAVSETKAFALLKRCFGPGNSVDLARNFREYDAVEGVRYFDVYFNPDAISVSDIDEWDFED